MSCEHTTLPQSEADEKELPDTRYIVLYGTGREGIEELQEKVNQHMNQGWLLAGGVSICSDSSLPTDYRDTRDAYCQAMYFPY